MPLSIKGVLFIENQDSYTCAMQGNPVVVRDLALVYSAGFRSSAERIRDVEGGSLHFSGEVVQSHRQEFHRFWLDNFADDLRAWFLGDLDYAGMNILKLLIKRFPQLRAWQSGYQIMLDHLRNGNGYVASGDDQQFQQDPETTDCEYAVKQLLPVLRQRGLLVVQEIVY